MYGTLHSAKHEEGIVATAIKYLSDKGLELSASFVEYYDGKWRDLVAGKEIKDQKLLVNCEMVQIRSVQEMNNFMKSTLIQRTTKRTNQNDTSSRSHAILIISINNVGQKMLFVDMAGNETLDGKSDVKETCFINKSLTQFNTVLVAKAKGLVPSYRDNDFTLFLKPYLSQNKAVIFYHVRKQNIFKDLMVIKDCILQNKKK